MLSSACLDRLVSQRLGRTLDTYEAVREEVAAAKAGGGFAGINIMVALQRDYEASVRGAIDAGADAIISGAGLPLSLPDIQPPGDTALIPIVSSARALDLICRRWERQHYRPDAVVLEGPLAGGHLGLPDRSDRPRGEQARAAPAAGEGAWRRPMATSRSSSPAASTTHEDIRRFLALGADGVQMGTRFLATEESSATEAYKQAVVRAAAGGHPRRARPGLALRPAVPRAARVADVPVGALAPTHAEVRQGLRAAQGRRRGSSRAAGQGTATSTYFCICNGLFAARLRTRAGEEEPLYTVGHERLAGRPHRPRPRADGRAHGGRVGGVVALPPAQAPLDSCESALPSWCYP